MVFPVIIYFSVVVCLCYHLAKLTRNEDQKHFKPLLILALTCMHGGFIFVNRPLVMGLKAGVTPFYLSSSQQE